MARTPFFMRFVEEPPKAVEPVRTDVTAGVDGGPRKGWEKPPETLKYPSDGDDDIRW